MDWRTFGGHVKDGLLSDICLAAVRGMDPVDFVVRLGADRRMTEQRVLFKHFDRRSAELADSAAMLGGSGDWAYVLEVEQSTWHLIYLDRSGQGTLVGRARNLSAFPTSCPSVRGCTTSMLFRRTAFRRAR